MPLHLNREDAEQIIRNIEKNGGDPSLLRQAVDSVFRAPSSRKTAIDVTDDALIAKMMELSPVTEGDSLVCVVCKTHTGKLYSDVCEACFRPWALSTRKEN